MEQGGKLYLCAEAAAPRNGRNVVVLASRELTRDELDVMAKGLGRILLSQAFSHLASDADEDTSDTENGKEEDSQPVHVNVVVPKDKDSDQGDFFDSVSSAPMAATAHAWRNPPVWFTAELPVTSWGTGGKMQAMIAVISRPSYLYALLFASSVRVGKFVWAILIGLGGVLCAAGVVCAGDGDELELDDYAVGGGVVQGDEGD